MPNFEEHLAQREAQNYSTTRRWSPQHEAVGLIGERELARFFGVPPNFTNRPGGDGGVDLAVPLCAVFACDVKSARHAIHLLVDAEKVRPFTIYVLAEVDVETDSAVLLGWEWGVNVRKAPKADWCNNGAIVHYIHRDNLRAMQELRDRHVTPREKSP